MIKRYLYSIAYFVVASMLLATLVIGIPVLVIRVLHGDSGFVEVLQSVLLMPFVAALGGSLLAGIPAVLTGFAMEFYRQIIPSVALYVAATVITAVALEFGYCRLLGLDQEIVLVLLGVSAVITAILSYLWWRWLDRHDLFGDDCF